MGPQPRTVDLFCGCGGFSLGAEMAGLGAALAIDVDPILSSSFHLNFPKSRLLQADIAEVTGSLLRHEAGGPIDGIFGGPPCQAFSDIGRRASDDPRRELLKHFFRIIREVQPSFFVMENVRGLKYSDNLPLLHEALGSLPRSYRVVGPMLLDAADYGAPTRRRRLFIVGYDPSRCAPMDEHNFRAATRERTDVRSAIADLCGAEEVEVDAGFDIWKITRPGPPTNYARPLRSADRRFSGHRPTAHTAAVVKRFTKLQPGEIDRVGRHPKLDWNGLCPTLRAGTGNDRGSYQAVRPVHPEEPRVISVREAARLQGFPDWFRFHPTVWHSFRMIGNSVSPLMSFAVFDVIRKRLLPPKMSIAAE